MKPNQSRLVVLLVFLLFGIPVVVAMLMHSSWWHYQPGGMTNRGQLVQPPRPLDYGAVQFDAAVEAPLGQWVILYPLSAPCNEACLAELESLRQIHRSSGRHQQHLAVMPLAGPGQDDPTDAMHKIYAAFLPAMDTENVVVETLAEFSDLEADGHLIAGQAFLVDPSGNIMMRYAAGFDPGDMNKDLKRLLKWSAQDG